MKLSLETFIYPILHPIEAGNKAVSLAFTACSFFAGGICQVAGYLRNCFTCRSSTNQLTEQEQKINQARNSALKTNSEEAPISAKVRPTLDKLFEDSPYKISSLPLYPDTVAEGFEGLKRDKMTDVVVIGETDKGRPFIAVKLACQLTDENIEKLMGSDESIKNHYKANRHMEGILVLSTRWDYPLEWMQRGTGRILQTPLFFTVPFTNFMDGTLIAGQKQNFEAVHSLLKEGSSIDVNGLTWVMTNS